MLTLAEPRAVPICLAESNDEVALILHSLVFAGLCIRYGGADDGSLCSGGPSNRGCFDGIAIHHRLQELRAQ